VGSTVVPGSPVADVRTEVTDGAMKEFKYELGRLSTEKVSVADLENAKRAIIGGFALSLEQPQSLLQNIITQKLYNLPADYWDTYPQKVSAITADDIQRVATKYLDMKNLQVVAVGDASKTREILSKYGTVKVYDAEGKLITGSVENNQ
jgi:predicted Zn-dependent peptidase